MILHKTRHTGKRRKMDETNTKAQEQLNTIITEKRIKSVYQPIVSLEDGTVFGYEGLSRIDLKNCEFNTEEMFHLADSMGKTWELERICRKKTLKNAIRRVRKTKLFINVDPKVITSKAFMEEVTGKSLYAGGIKPSDIVFEITERTRIEDTGSLKKVLQTLKDMDFKIAIDDFGNGYAGLRRVCALDADCLKIDMTIVRDIDKDNIKKMLVESFVTFCKSSKIRLIAEGIETKEELNTLIQMKVEYGQGYFLGKPNSEILDIEYDKREMIQQMYNETFKHKYKPSFFGNVGSICKQKEVTTPDAPGYALYEFVENNPQITEICVIDHEKKVQGLLTRNELLEKFGGRFGYSLHAKKTAKELIERSCIVVDAMDSIEEVSKMALSRPISKMYDAIVVIQAKKYLGIVTVKDLLETAITIQVNRATDANPLTKLPGNTVIESRVREIIASQLQYSIIYIDLDNFKAYNDAYGFSNGNLMIMTAANCMEQCCCKEEFCGHIGGDDFVIITDYWEVEQLCQQIIDLFQREIRDLYNQTDLENGFIISKNRNGFEEQFPLSTISIAIVTNRNRTYDDISEFSKDLANTKKKSKQVIGNSIICI
jgi:diguanylate cyclase (GGDEF)-like protein